MADESRNDEQSNSPDSGNDALNGEADRRPIGERFLAARSRIANSVGSLMSAFTRTNDASAGRVDNRAEAEALGIRVEVLDDIRATVEIFLDMQDGSERFRADEKNNRWFFIDHGLRADISARHPYRVLGDKKTSQLITETTGIRVGRKDLIGKIDFTPGGEQRLQGAALTSNLIDSINGWTSFFEAIDQGNIAAPKVLVGKTFESRMAKFAEKRWGFVVRDLTPEVSDEDSKQYLVVGETNFVREKIQEMATGKTLSILERSAELERNAKRKKESKDSGEQQPPDDAV